MTTGLLIIITIINTLSFLLFFLVHREIRRVTKSHVELVQKVNAALIETRSLKATRSVYFWTLVFLAVMSYLLYFFWIT